MTVVTDTLIARAGERLRAGYLKALTNAAGFTGHAFASTTVSATFVDVGTLFSFTKLYASTAVVVSAHYSVRVATAAPGVAEFAIQVGGVDYECGYVGLVTINEHRTFCGFVRIPSLAAGSGTYKLRVRRVSGAGTLTWDAQDYCSARVWEAQE